MNLSQGQPSGGSGRQNGSADRPAETASKNKRSTDQGKTKPEDTKSEVLDIQVDDPNIPKGGVVLTDRDENGKVTMLRVTPRVPRPPNSTQPQKRRFNLFSPGFDFKKLMPAQQRKLQQLWIQQQKRKANNPAPPLEPKPTP